MAYIYHSVIIIVLLPLLLFHSFQIFQFVSCFSRIKHGHIPHKYFTQLLAHKRQSKIISRKIPHDAYSGPIANTKDMEVGFELEELGLNVMTGPSLAGYGRGLFISLLDGIDKVSVPQGTVLCGYSKGSFKNESCGDKTVGCLVTNVNSLVIFEKLLMPLFDAMHMVSERVSNLTTVLEGHLLYSNESEELHRLIITPDPNFNDRYYFIPDSCNDMSVTISNIGIFANDLAYKDTMTMSEYEKSANTSNILMLVWRLAFDSQYQQLRFTWPVVIFNKDVEFKNKNPMEVGIEYSWGYWSAARNASLGTALDT